MNEGAVPDETTPWREAIRRLEARVSALEDRLPREVAAGPVPAGAAVEAPPETPAEDAWVAGLWTGFPLAGRTLLALGGAFLIRAGTDSGLVPPLGGVVAGLAYALLWLLLGDREAARGRRASANFHASAAVLVGYPLLWEATTRFAYITPAGSVLGLSLLTFPALFLAWRREAALVASMFTVAAAGSALGLSFATRSAVLYTAWLTALGVVTLWIAYSRRWVALPWLVAACTDVAVLRVVLAGVAAAERGTQLVGVAPAAARAVAGALPIAYLGSIALRTLWKRRDVGPFEITQSVVALVLGVGGAAAITRAQGQDPRLLGAGALTAALVAYAVAFLFVRRQLGRGRVFFFYGTLALALAIGGAALAGEAATRTATWSLLGVASAILGARFDRVSLRAHAALYAAAAAVSSGLLAGATAAIAHGAPIRPEQTWAAVALAGAAAAYATLIARRSDRRPPGHARAPRLVLAAITVAGGVGAVSSLTTGAFPSAGGGPVAVEAFAVRTLVLAAAAIALAWTARRTGLAELGRMAWLLLAAGGAKLLLQDLKEGGSASLFLAFACYGAALVVAPRLLRPPSD